MDKAIIHAPIKVLTEDLMVAQLAIKSTKQVNIYINSNRLIFDSWKVGFNGQVTSSVVTVWLFSSSVGVSMKSRYLYVCNKWHCTAFTTYIWRCGPSWGVVCVSGAYYRACEVVKWSQSACASHVMPNAFINKDTFSQLDVHSTEDTHIYLLGTVAVTPSHCIITITDGQTASLSMSVSIMPSLPHPTSKVSMPAIINLMQIAQLTQQHVI